ncbi:cytoplasmic protein NCK2-like [Corythoichthys intestinalis]|uniref:cytoplasmic protein NCK2-like n=1 Tax=Corythoichthys intestinalis TaxID=161448 RepID=UPI0025A5C71B|nr:cytoplasmic protein NCK2-like [Corythoichthys intestinalis]
MAGNLEEDLRCPTCLDIFKDPVMLPCSHNFCRACLQQWEDTGERSCPICRTTFQSKDIPANLALRNICENILRAPVKSQDICSLHKEELKLFCLDHRELVCLVCRDAEIHAGHKILPLEEVAERLAEPAGPPLPERDYILRSGSGPFAGKEWYYGKVTRHQAEVALNKRGTKGDFLIRDSQSSPNAFTISLKAQSKNVHLKVELKGSLYCTGPRMFNSMEELVEHYKKAPIYISEQGNRQCLVKALSDPASKNTIPSSRKHL